METETNIIDKTAFNKRLKSMRMTLQSLEAQIEDNQHLLQKELKHRVKTEPKPEIVKKTEELNEETKLDELKRRLREQALEAARRRKEDEEGKLEFSLAIA